MIRTRSVMMCGLVALTLGACARENPNAPAGLLASNRGGNGNGRWSRASFDVVQSNAKDHDHDKLKDWTGRSGSAAILATAIAGTSQTQLTVTSYKAADSSFTAPTGNIVKLLVKGYSASGRLLFTLNFNNLAPASNQRIVPLPAMDVGSSVSVQANVTSIDKNRTDVVTANAGVVAHPANLAVGPVSAQQRWYLNLPLPVSATVTETGGDVSARATCGLYVDGTMVDHIANLLVAAGGTVSCSFSYAFPSIGTHEVKVQVTNVVPGDANPDDNVSLGRVDIYSAGGVLLPAFNYTAQVGDLVIDDYDSTYTRISALDGTVLENNSLVDAAQGRDQSSTFTGIYYGLVSFPLARLALAQSSAGVVLHADTLYNLPDNGQGTVPCTNGSEAGGVEFSLCSYPNQGLTVLTYTRHAGLVQYRSQAYNYLFDASACTSDDGCWVDTRTDGTGSATTWGTSVNYDVSLTAGDTTYAAAPAIPLTSLDSTSSYGPTCASSTIQVTVPGPFGITITVNQNMFACVAGRSRHVGVVGNASGVGVTTLNATP